MKRVMIILAVAALIFGGTAAQVCVPASAAQWSDDLSSDTTAAYQVVYWPYYGGPSGVPSIVYDGPNQRAIVQGVGGYGHIVMEKVGASPIPAGADFSVSADVDVLSEYSGYIYLGDNLPLFDTGTNLRLRLTTFSNMVVVHTMHGGSRLVPIRDALCPEQRYP